MPKIMSKFISMHLHAVCIISPVISVNISLCTREYPLISVFFLKTWKQWSQQEVFSGSSCSENEVAYVVNVACV